MKNIITTFLFCVFLFACSAQKPTKEDITKCMKSTWEKAEGPKSTVTINNIKFGETEKSNYAHQLEGVPKKSPVTHAKIDWTYNEFYNNETRKTRRITTAWVYKDQFGEWAVMNNGTVYPK